MPSARTVFAATWIAYAGFYLCRKNFGVLMPLFAEHAGATRDLLAQVLFLYSAAYAVGQIVCGVLADRIGARPVAIGGMLLSAAATVATGCTDDPRMLYVWQAANGLAQACGWPALVKIVAGWFEPSRRGVAMGWWCTNYAIGAFAATAYATFAATGGPWSWRAGAWIPAATLALLVAPVWRYAKPGPLAPTAAPEARRGAFRLVWRNPALRTIAVSYFCLKLTRYAFLFWLPTYMVEHLAYGPAEAGYTSALYELSGFGGVLLAGYVSDRLLGGRRFPVGAAMLAGLALACFAFPALSAAGRLGNWVAIGLVGALTFGPDTLMGGAATQDCAHPAAAATAAGFVNSVGSSGQMLSPLVVAYVVDAFGWQGLFACFGVLAAIGAAALAGRWNAVPASAPGAGAPVRIAEAKA